MPDSDPSSSSAATDRTSEPRNLPAVIPAPTDAGRESGDGLLNRWIRALFRWRGRSVRADLKVVLEESTQTETGFSPEEVIMLKNILGLRERRVSDVMVPRADIVAVQQEIAIGELVKVFEGAGHSRLVVFNDTLDDPVGMVHIRDLIAFMTARATVAPAPKSKRRKSLAAGLDLKAIDLSMPLSAAKIMRTILFVPPSMPAIDLLAKMQATRIHLALVVDEYGGTDGIASMEDIVEQIVGEIDDEHDDDEAPSVVQQTDGSFIADARASLEDVIAIIGNGFTVGEAAKDVDTLGGYLVTQIGRVPVRGELVSGPGTFEFEVLDADPRRVKKVKIHSGKIPRASRARESRNIATAARQKQPASENRASDATAASDPSSSGPQQS
jgi:CBS domain containing-hemolysin-like protein